MVYFYSNSILLITNTKLLCLIEQNKPIHFSCSTILLQFLQTQENVTFHKKRTIAFHSKEKTFHFQKKKSTNINIIKL